MATPTVEELQVKLIELNDPTKVGALMASTSSDIANKVLSGITAKGALPSAEQIAASVRGSLDSFRASIADQKVTLQDSIKELKKSQFLEKYKTDFTALETAVNNQGDTARFTTAKTKINPSNFDLNVDYQKTAFEQLEKLYKTALDLEVTNSVNKLQDILDQGKTDGKPLKDFIAAECGTSTAGGHLGDVEFATAFRNEALKKLNTGFAERARDTAKEAVQKEVKAIYLNKLPNRFRLAMEQIDDNARPKPATSIGQPAEPAKIGIDQAKSLRLEVDAYLKELASRIAAEVTAKSSKTLADLEAAITAEIAKETAGKGDELLKREVRAQLADQLKQFKTTETEKATTERQAQNVDNLLRAFKTGSSAESTFPPKTDGSEDKVAIRSRGELLQQARDRRVDISEELKQVDAMLKDQLSETIQRSMEDTRNAAFSSRSEGIRTIKQMLSSDRIPRQLAGELLTQIENKHNSLVSEYFSDLAKVNNRSDWESTHPNLEARKAAEEKARLEMASKEEECYTAVRKLLSSRDDKVWDRNTGSLRYDSELVDVVGQELSLNLLEKEALLSGSDPKLLTYIKDIAEVYTEVKSVSELELSEQFSGLDEMIGKLQISEQRKQEITEGLKASRENVDRNKTRVRRAKRWMVTKKWLKRAALVGGIVGAGVAGAGLLSSSLSLLQSAGTALNIIPPTDLTKVPFARQIAPAFLADPANAIATGVTTTGATGELLTRTSQLISSASLFGLGFAALKGAFNLNLGPGKLQNQQREEENMRIAEAQNRTRRANERQKVYDILKEYAKSRLQDKRIAMPDADFSRIFGDVLAPAVDGVQKTTGLAEMETAKLRFDEAAV